MTPVDVSIVIPAFDERPNLEPLLVEVATALAGERHEIVLVDDGSTDGTGAEARRLGARLPALRVVSLAAHAGQSAALMAGWDAARGTLLVSLDADGQNDPSDIPALLELVRVGTADAVVGYRAERASGRWRAFQSRAANLLRNLITGDRVRDSACSLRVVPRRMVADLPRFDGMHRFIPTLLRRAGCRVLEAPVAERPRRYGRSHYGFRNRAVRALRDALGVRWLVRRPLTFTVTPSEENP